MRALTRILVLTTVLAAIVLVGFSQIIRQLRESSVAELRTLNTEMAERIAEHRDRYARLTQRRRIAHLRVTDQALDDTGRVLRTHLDFIELDENGGELATQTFEIPGDVVFVDAWTVKFDPEDIAAGHPLRGHTLVLLRRIFSEEIAPADGFPIDTPGAIPPAYATSDRSHFEQEIWTHFWDIARDADLAEAVGARVVQGEAAYLPVTTGDVLELTVEAAGGINLSRNPILVQKTQVN